MCDLCFYASTAAFLFRTCQRFAAFSLGRQRLDEEQRATGAGTSKSGPSETPLHGARFAARPLRQRRPGSADAGRCPKKSA